MTSTTTPQKTVATTLIAIQKVNANSIVLGGNVDVSAKLAAFIRIRFGRITAVAPTIPVTVRIEGGGNAAGKWCEIARFTSGIAAAITKVPSATSGAALTVPNVTSLVAQDVNVVSSVTSAYAENNTEWFRTLSAASTTVTAEEALANAYTTGGMWNNAEIAGIQVDLSPHSNLRAVVDGIGHNQAFLIAVDMDTFNSTIST